MVVVAGDRRWTIPPSDLLDAGKNSESLPEPRPSGREKRQRLP